MKLKKLITGLLGMFILGLVINTTNYKLPTTNLAHADDFEPADDDENASNNLILDADNTGGDVSLQFGAALAESLTWDNANTRFNLSDDFVVDGSLSQNGTSFTLDFDEAGDPDQDIDIIAGQGSENNGVLRYDDGSNRWEFSNDGSTFQAIPTSGGGGGSSDLATAQMRETDGENVGSPGFANIDFNVVDEESDASTINADEATDSFTVLADGYYLITYDFTDANDINGSISAQVLLNGSTVINGSTSSTGIRTNLVGGGDFGQNFITQLSASDSVTLQMSSSAVNALDANGVFTITKLEGAAGATGAAGIDGVDGVDGVVGPGTTSNTYTIDDDDTGGDVILQFGTALNETLTWDSINTEFDLSDNLDINLTGEHIELGDGTANDFIINFDDGTDRNFGWDDSRTAFNFSESVDIDGTILTLDADETANPDQDLDIVAEQGSENNGTLRYDDGNNRWEASNDGGTFHAIQTANVFYAYDAAGGQTINATEITLNLDTTIVSDSAYTLAANEIAINEDGLYRIKYQLGMDDTDTGGGARSTVELTLQEGGIDIPGAVIRCYYREARENSCSLEIVHLLSATDILRARIDRTSGTTNFETEPNHSRLIIEKIR